MPESIETIGQDAIDYFTLKHAARERALPRSRAAIRLCANSIRATHRQEFEKAGTLISEAGALLTEMKNDLADHHDIYYAGFVQDAQKEFAEAATFSVLTRHLPLPTPHELGVSYAAYLNGIAEAIGELRRYLLDQLRQGHTDLCEPYLNAMDDIYAVLIAIDFPDAITSGLRRATDNARGILEKTRGDLTTAVVQAKLQHAMLALQTDLQQSVDQ